MVISSAISTSLNFNILNINNQRPIKTNQEHKADNVISNLCVWPHRSANKSEVSCIDKRCLYIHALSYFAEIAVRSYGIESDRH